MYFHLFLLVCFLFQSYFLYEIIPDIMDLPPKTKLEVIYTIPGKYVNYGNELTPTEVIQRPFVSFNASEGEYYTLIMVDPDVPGKSNPYLRSFRHWFVGNIPGSNVDLGQTVSEYVGLGTPEGTGFHRYIFLLYEQPGIIEFDEPHSDITDAKFRGQFSIRDFERKYGFGQPIAGNFFLAQFDESAPLLQAQLGIVVVEVCPQKN